MTIFETMRTLFPALAEREAGRLNPLVLAFVGDTLYDLAVRTVLLEKHDATVHALHTRAAGIVCARSQALAAQKLRETLSDEETAIYMRARNAKPGKLPKNADPGEYHAATALEAVLGYLYLTKQDERLMQLLLIALEDNL